MATKHLSKSGHTYIWSGGGEHLESFVKSIGLEGQWSTIAHGKQFRNPQGISFNWYQKAGKIVIQGSAQQNLRALFEKSLESPIELYSGQYAHLTSTNKENSNINNASNCRKRKAEDRVQRYAVPEAFQPLAYLADGICGTMELHRYLAHQLATWSEITIAAPALTARGMCMVRTLGRSHVNLIYTSARALRTILEELSADERASMSEWIEEKVVVVDADNVRFLAGSNSFESMQVVLSSCDLDDRLFEEDTRNGSDSCSCSQSVVTLSMSCYTFNVKWLSALLQRES